MLLIEDPAGIGDMDATWKQSDNAVSTKVNTHVVERA
jgi:hypothetical protein